MAEYKIIGSTISTVANGIYNSNGFADGGQSSFFRPTMLSDRTARYMRCDIGVKVVVANDSSVFISVNGGNITLESMPNDNEYFGWPKAFLAASLSPFQLAPMEGDANQFQISQNGSINNYTFSNSFQWNEGATIGSTVIFYSDFGIYTPKGGGVAKAYRSWYDPNGDPSTNGFTEGLAGANSTIVDGYEFEGSEAQFYAHMSSLGYYYVGKISSWPELEGVKHYGVVYISGLCLFNSDAPNSIGWTDAARIPIEGFDKFLKFYPWERRIEGQWMSLNRDGGMQVNTGLFRRQNGIWLPMTNELDESSSENHAFRYNNGWQRSPKSGIGAQ